MDKKKNTSKVLKIREENKAEPGCFSDTGGAFSDGQVFDHVNEKRRQRKADGVILSLAATGFLYASGPEYFY